MMDTQEDTPLYVFNYQPLNELRDEIRLLTVQKVDQELTAEHCRLDHACIDGIPVVCCSIEHASLSHPPSYKGLSYCWGDRNSTSTIHLNGAEVHVTANLEDALRQLGRDESMCLWVDALCINQSDAIERGRQVLRMGDIYRNASETICWLGVEAEDSPLAFDLIRILSRTDDDDSASTQYEEALTRLYRPSDNHKYDSHWKAYLLLFSRPYWKRIWIIQEIVSSKKVWIRCGLQCIEWEDILVAINSVGTIIERNGIKAVSRVFSSNLAYTGSILSIDALRGFSQQAKSRSDYVGLLNAMKRSNKALATVPIDKIYGLLAITKDGRYLIPHPDYTLSAEELCRMTTAAIITASTDLDIICYAKTPHRRVLPSWVPQWTGVVPELLLAWQNAGREDLYNATGRSRGGEYLRMPHTGDFLNKGLVLKARGFILDAVSGLGAFDLLNEPSLEVNEETTYELVQPAPEHNRSQYGSENGIFKALWLSLVLGERDDQLGSSQFLNSLYVVQASNGKAIADGVNVVFESWYSMNKAFEIHGRALSQWFRVSTADKNRPERDIIDLTNEEKKFLEDILLASLHKRLLFTQDGFIGMAPPETKKGDVVCLLLGCRVPVVLRERIEGGYELVGEAYVHGVMKGEAMTKANEERLQDFCIH